MHELSTSSSLQLLCTVILVVSVLRDILQVLHMCPYQHVPKHRELAVRGILDINYTPRVYPPPYLRPADVVHRVAADYSEWDTRLEFFVHPNELLVIFFFVSLWKLINLNLVALDLAEDSFLQLFHFLLRKSVRLRYHGNDIHLIMEILHDRNVERFQPMSCCVDEV